MLHVPLNRNFGGSRVQLELAEEWQKQGHHITKFDANDAYPQAKHSLFHTLTRPRFHTKAEQFIREQGHRFDIIDAHQGNVTCSKASLGFSGLWVTRSVGLYPLYEAFRRSTLGNVPESWKTRLVNGVLAWRDRKEMSHCFQSYHHCDLINLPNPDEKAYLNQAAGLGEKCVVFPFGLSDQRLTTLQQSSKPPAVRLQSPQVVFIGTWCLRKGSKDWPQIIQRVKAAIPEVQFLFLGTGSPANVVLEDLNLPSSDGIKIIPSYDSDTLPHLLENGTVGVFPSYIEGFGFAVLEKLAAGIPTIAYDVPGPREMLQQSPLPLMVQVGDTQALSQKLIDLLRLEVTQYSSLVRDCQTIAETFRWSRIATEMLAVYQEHLTQFQ
ncbi:MAG: glycosyltransferase family 4 protein [Kamptonema sp. SIO4C4]|nr:glycosyltransferase family 4 protein [Kamptonema sp. SIO4C4]